MNNVLDNPVWHALTTGNSVLAQGTEYVKVFPKDVSPIVGMQDYTDANFRLLHDMSLVDSPVVIFSVEKLVIPDAWDVLVPLTGYQMVYTGTALPPATDEEIVSLTNEHIPQMLALTALTNPGPFASGTINFGHYEGIFKGGELAAMAGQRLHPFGYAEISAVCTHPNYTGQGLARQLLIQQIDRIIIAGEIPFLHVRDDNSRAVDVYKKLGFEIRTAINFYVLKKKEKIHSIL